MNKLVNWLFLLILCTGLFGFTPAASASVSLATDEQKVLHVIDRLSLGVSPGEVARVKSMGVERYIQEQLLPDSIPQPQDLTRQLAQLETLTLTPEELYRQYGRSPQNSKQRLTQAEIGAAQAKARPILEQAIQARLLQAIASPRQLQEVMVDFWDNHFNVYAQKGLDRLWIGAYEQEAIRPHVLGRFRDLLGATAQHPAMLFYLDNWQNTAPDSPGARGRFQGLNENYARELMELHTLGVEGGYTQDDVIALAKILTGWGFRRADRSGDQVANQQVQTSEEGYGFSFNSKRHDFSDKVFLKQPIQGSGMAEGEQALDILAKSPATAKHISYELAQYFVADQPPAALVDRLSQEFLQSDGDIRAVLNTLFHSAEFWDTQYFNAKFKTPYQYVVSAVRATEVQVSNFKAIDQVLQQMGMPIYGCHTPDGYKNTQDIWLNSGAMIQRLNLALSIANGRSPLIRPEKTNANSSPSPIDAIQLRQTLGQRFSSQTQTAIATSPEPLQVALMLGSPEFMHH